MQNPKDMTGLKFGRLTATSRHGSDARGNATWNCSCDCGKSTIVRGGHLRSGQVTSCGGKGRGCRRMDDLDITGKRYGRLVVVGETHRTRNRAGSQAHLLCLCDCGREHNVARSNLVSGNCQSCGCLHKEITVKRSTKHGRHATTEYRLLCSSRARAKKAGLPNDLDLDDIQIPKHCPLLGVELKPSRRAISPCSPTLDRKRPDLGYVKGNVWVISQKANQMKSDLTVEQMRHFADVIEASTKHPHPGH